MGLPFSYKQHRTYGALKRPPQVRRSCNVSKTSLASLTSNIAHIMTQRPPVNSTHGNTNYESTRLPRFRSIEV